MGNTSASAFSHFVVLLLQSLVRKLRQTRIYDSDPAINDARLTYFLFSTKQVHCLTLPSSVIFSFAALLRQARAAV